MTQSKGRAKERQRDRERGERWGAVRRGVASGLLTALGRQHEELRAAAACLLLTDWFWCVFIVIVMFPSEMPWATSREWAVGLLSSFVLPLAVKDSFEVPTEWENILT